MKRFLSCLYLFLFPRPLSAAGNALRCGKERATATGGESVATQEESRMRALEDRVRALADEVACSAES